MSMKFLSLYNILEYTNCYKSDVIEWLQNNKGNINNEEIFKKIKEIFNERSSKKDDISNNLLTYSEEFATSSENDHQK